MGINEFKAIFLEQVEWGGGKERAFVYTYHLIIRISQNFKLDQTFKVTQGRSSLPGTLISELMSENDCDDCIST